MTYMVNDFALYSFLWIVGGISFVTAILAVCVYFAVIAKGFQKIKKGLRFCVGAIVLVPVLFFYIVFFITFPITFPISFLLDKWFKD